MIFSSYRVWSNKKQKVVTIHRVIEKIRSSCSGCWVLKNTGADEYSPVCDVGCSGSIWVSDKKYRRKYKGDI